MSKNCIDIQHDVWKRAKWYTSHIFYIFYGNMGNKSCCFSPRKFTRQARKTLRFISRISIYYRGRQNQGAWGGGGGGHLPSLRFWKYLPEVKHFSTRRAYVFFFVKRSLYFRPSDGTVIYHGAESGTKLSFQHKKELVKWSFSRNASIQNKPNFGTCLGRLGSSWQ